MFEIRIKKFNFHRGKCRKSFSNKKQSERLNKVANKTEFPRKPSSQIYFGRSFTLSLFVRRSPAAHLPLSFPLFIFPLHVGVATRHPCCLHCEHYANACNKCYPTVVVLFYFELHPIDVWMTVRL